MLSFIVTANERSLTLYNDTIDKKCVLYMYRQELPKFLNGKDLLSIPNDSNSFERGKLCDGCYMMHD